MTVLLSSVFPMPLKFHTGHYSSTRITRNPVDDSFGSLLELTHYIMRGPTFPPYPCAGVSLFTYVLEQSPGSLRCRDSQGGDFTLQPGDLIGMNANCGIVYDECMSNSSIKVEAIQVLISQPATRKSSLAETFIVPQTSNKIIRKGSNRIRVIVGNYNKHYNDDEETNDFGLSEILLYETENILLNRNFKIILYQTTGELSISNGKGSRNLSGGEIMVISSTNDSSITLQPKGFSLCLVLTIPESTERVVRNNAMCMPTEDMLNDAIERYRSGRMGFLTSNR